MRKGNLSKITIITTGALALASPVFLFADWGYGCWGNDYWFGSNHWFGGGIFMFLITLIIIALAVFFFYSSSKNRIFTAGNSPLEILKMRYARGELTKEEFEKMKSELG